MELTQHEIILSTLEKNLEDYDEELSKAEIQKIISVYRTVLKEGKSFQQIQKFNELVSKIEDEREKDIINYLKSRSNKFAETKLPGFEKKEYEQTSLKICRTPDNLKPSVIRLSNGTIKSLPYDDIKYKKRNVYLDQKQKFLKKNNNRTMWMFEKTVDHRYVWRSTLMVDKNNVEQLLYFILKKRDTNSDCPSILINAGSHGSISGQNSAESQNPNYTDMSIYDEVYQVISKIISMNEMRLTMDNRLQKIYVHKVSSSVPCAYPELADHIIDVQCQGAYQMISNKDLHPRSTNYRQSVDLKFLYQSKEQKFIQNITQFTDKVIPAKINSFKSFIEDLITNKSAQNKTNNE